MIKVAMIVRSTLFTVKGGDTIQVTQTAAHLSRIGVVADVKITNEKINYSEYDLLHFFNISRPADILYHIKTSKKPFVISTIFIDYTGYDKYYRKGIVGMVFKFLGTNGIEYVKTISRWITGKDTLVSLSYIWKGQRKSINEILSHATLLLPNSHSEYSRLIKTYKCITDHLVIPNGIDPALFRFDSSIEKDKQMVLCVARIEGIKNQLNLIKALNNTAFNLIIIGSPAPNQPAYYRVCKNMAASNVTFINHLSQEELVSYYQKAKVHILPSWFETTGLSSLEAAAMGCNIVITGNGDTKEYFGTHAFYCNPALPADIYHAIETAASLPEDDFLRRKILTHYSWEQATIKTMEAYKRIKNIWD